MASFLHRLGRAAKAALDHLGEGRFAAGGEVVACPVCHGESFVQVPDRGVRRPLFMKRNLPGLSLDRYATTLICTECSHLVSFGRPPERITDEDFDRR